MKKTSHRVSGRSGGFSLVEVTLALLIVGIGLLSLLGLFGEGIRMTRGSEKDAYMADFAESLLESVRAEYSLSGNFPGSVPAPGFQSGGSSTVWTNSECTGANYGQINTSSGGPYQFRCSSAGGGGYSLQYSLDMQTMTATNPASATLYLWPDYYADEPSRREAEIFYTEFFRHN
ncbi:type IV pilus modification PilV family protein [Kiritimatiella glycovorans]|uniref:Type IV pilus modification protein PilV n=1 Tax=Kiritimatiella glycovorans TaxID=1307763 RepID=A0A0G3EH32_9BACT|nr:hypothetical protein [Kiritimatiella glycovorans]AKJ63444.1 type IV pilus modification protein PilV [Kiritimatiella glycovorans]